MESIQALDVDYAFFTILLCNLHAFTKYQSYVKCLFPLQWSWQTTSTSNAIFMLFLKHQLFKSIDHKLNLSTPLSSISWQNDNMFFCFYILKKEQNVEKFLIWKKTQIILLACCWSAKGYILFFFLNSGFISNIIIMTNLHTMFN